jgi:hypothetical protein
MIRPAPFGGERRGRVHVARRSRPFFWMSRNAACTAPPPLGSMTAKITELFACAMASATRSSDPDYRAIGEVSGGKSIPWNLKRRDVGAFAFPELPVRIHGRRNGVRRFEARFGACTALAARS